MKIPDKLYDILKWVVIIVLPAIATLYAALVRRVGLALLGGDRHHHHRRGHLFRRGAVHLHRHL